MADQTSFDLTKRGTFRLFTPVTIRFSDTDALGHVNNVATAAYVESARCEIFYKLMREGGLDSRGSGDEHIDFVLARVAIDYRKEYFYPGTVEVGVRFIRLGNRSITTGYGVFIGDTCHATAESVNVFFDLKTRRPVTPPPAVRGLLEAEVRQ
ncbi:MAG: acyl-CoA thioesterase [Hyphomicrobiaceae bacterium]